MSTIHSFVEFVFIVFALKKINDQIKCFHFASHGTIHINQNKDFPFIVLGKKSELLKIIFTLTLHMSS